MRLVFELILSAGSFYAGARYGRNAEAKAIALALRVESYGKQELVAVISKIRTLESSALARLRKVL